MGKFELEKLASRFTFSFRGANGEMILSSAFYASKLGAERAISTAKASASIVERVDRRVSETGRPYFALTGVDGAILALSEKFSTTSAMNDAIEFVVRYAPHAPVDDLTTPPP